MLPGSGGSVTFKYDPFGRRIQKSFTQNSTTTITNYLYDGANSLEEMDPSGNVLARYTQAQGIDEPLAMLRGGDASYYEADGLGSVTSLSNAAGSLAQTYTRDSFGNQIGSSGSLTNPFQYTAREFDAETSLYYYRARYYDPQSGRFLSEDPLTRHVASSYSYVDNQPTEFSDFSGPFPVPDCVRRLLSPYFPRLNWNLVDLHTFVPMAPGITGMNAFTWNNDIYTSPSQYLPNITPGITLIAHELTHVQQFQTDGKQAFVGWYTFDFLLNYYFDRDWDKAYRNTLYEQQANEVETKVTGDLLLKFGLKDPCPKEKACSSK